MVGGRWQILVSVEDGSAGAGAEEGSDFEPGSRLARLKGAGENYLLRARGYGPRIRLYFPVVLSCSNLTIHGSRPSAYGLQGVVQLKSQNPVKKKKAASCCCIQGWLATTHPAIAHVNSKHLHVLCHSGRVSVQGLTPTICAVSNACLPCDARQGLLEGTPKSGVAARPSKTQG